MICSITPLVDACRPQVPCFSLVYYILFWPDTTTPPFDEKNIYALIAIKILEYYGRHHYYITAAAAKADAFLQWFYSLPNTIYCQFRQFIYKKFKLKRAPLSSDWFRMSDWQLLRWWSECKKRNLPKRTLAIKLLECNFFFIISVLLFSTSALQLAFQWR